MSYMQLSRKDQEGDVVGAADRVEPSGKYYMGLSTKKYGRVHILEVSLQEKKKYGGAGQEQNRFLFNLLNITFKNPIKTTTWPISLTPNNGSTNIDIITPFSVEEQNLLSTFSINMSLSSIELVITLQECFHSLFP